MYVKIKEFLYSLEISILEEFKYTFVGFLGHMNKFNRIITVDILRLFVSMYFYKI